MTENRDQEVKRILDMVESGAVAPAEGERLLQALSAATRTACPFCAEQIPLSAERCPECRSALRIQPTPSGAARLSRGGFQGLSGLGKALVIYLFVATALVLFPNLRTSVRYVSLAPMTSMALAILGIVAGVMLCCSRPAGWTLAILWSALQIVPVYVNGHKLNGQWLHVGANYLQNGDGLGINIWAIVLVFLFLAARRESGRTPAAGPLCAPRSPRP